MRVNLVLWVLKFFYISLQSHFGLKSSHASMLRFIFQVCQSLGWKGKGGRFDVLPLVLQASGGVPEYFDIPEHLVLQVDIKHPK